MSKTSSFGKVHTIRFDANENYNSRCFFPTGSISADDLKFIGRYTTAMISICQVLYRLLTFYRQVPSGDLRTLAGGFSLRKVTCLMLRLYVGRGNL
jgi:hypothetical protein